MPAWRTVPCWCSRSQEGLGERAEEQPAQPGPKGPGGRQAQRPLLLEQRPGQPPPVRVQQQARGGPRVVEAVSLGYQQFAGLASQSAQAVEQAAAGDGGQFENSIFQRTQPARAIPPTLWAAGSRPVRKTPSDTRASLTCRDGPRYRISDPTPRPSDCPNSLDPLRRPVRAGPATPSSRRMTRQPVCPSPKCRSPRCRTPTRSPERSSADVQGRPRRRARTRARIRPPCDSAGIRRP